MDGKNRRPFRLPSKFKKRARCCIAEDAVTMAIRGEGGCGGGGVCYNSFRIPLPT